MNAVSCERFATLSLFLLPVLIAGFVITMYLGYGWRNERDLVAYSKYVSASKVFCLACVTVFAINSVILVFLRDEVGTFNAITTIIYAFTTMVMVAFE